MGWIRIRIDTELLPGSGSGINHPGSITLILTEAQIFKNFFKIMLERNYVYVTPKFNCFLNVSDTIGLTRW